MWHKQLQVSVLGALLVPCSALSVGPGVTLQVGLNWIKRALFLKTEKWTLSVGPGVTLQVGRGMNPMLFHMQAKRCEYVSWAHLPIQSNQHTYNLMILNHPFDPEINLIISRLTAWEGLLDPWVRSLPTARPTSPSTGRSPSSPGSFALHAGECS